MSFNTHEMGPSTSNYASDLLKRQREEDSCDLGVFSKRQRHSDWYIFIPENSPVLSWDESIYSMQGWEAEFCQDTPDTSSSDGIDTDVLGDLRARVNRRLATIEYEVASLSEAENPFGRSCSSDSSSENDDSTKITKILLEVGEDEACWGDDSHSDTHTTSTDQEISPCDFWTYLRCKCINKPIHRYCRKCFQVRKNWFPPRPRHKRKKKNKSRQRNRSVFDASAGKDDVDSGLGSFSNKESGEVSAHNSSGSHGSSFVSEQSKECEDDTKGTNVVTAIKNDKCITCRQRPKNAVFVHETVGHICCCYNCAKKVWSSSGKCPVCNRKTNCVVKVFVA